MLAGASGLFGITLGADEQAQVADAAMAIASAVGGLLAVYGRVKADKRLANDRQNYHYLSRPG